MSRIKGIAPFSANFEPQMAAPLDARAVVSTKAELLLAATWTANDGGIYTYLGMTVCVSNDGANNGIWALLNADYTQASSWVKATGETGIQGVTGIYGLTGIYGQTGFQGVTGIYGMTGVPGINGINGITGAMGIPNLVDTQIVYGQGTAVGQSANLVYNYTTPAVVLNGDMTANTFNSCEILQDKDNGNVFIGKAGIGCSSQNNTIVGYNSGNGGINTNGENTVVGFNSLTAACSGISNTVLGTYAMTSNLTGSENIAIGNLALTTNKYGYGNIAIGLAAGKTTIYSEDNTSPTNSIYIGYDCMPYHADDNNCIIISGQIGQGLGANTTSIGDFVNTSLTYLAGKICIGQRTIDPTYRLTCNGGIIDYGNIFNTGDMSNQGNVSIDGTVNINGAVNRTPALTVQGKIVGNHGWGHIAPATTHVTKYFKVGSLAYYPNYDPLCKVYVKVWGGGFYGCYGSRSGIDEYTIGCNMPQDAYTPQRYINMSRRLGSTVNYTLKINDNGSNYDIWVCVEDQDYPGIVIESQTMGPDNAFCDNVITEYTGLGDPIGNEDTGNWTWNNTECWTWNNKVGFGLTDPWSAMSIKGSHDTSNWGLNIDNMALDGYQAIRLGARNSDRTVTPLGSESENYGGGGIQVNNINYNGFDNSHHNEYTDAWNNTNTVVYGGGMAGLTFISTALSAPMRWFTLNAGDGNTIPNTEKLRMLMSSFGNLYLGDWGTFGTNEKFNVSGNIATTSLAGSGNRAVYSTSTGILTNSSSDASMKYKIKTLDNCLDKVLALNPIEFYWKPEHEKKLGLQKEIGFTAQDMSSVYPEVVGSNSDSKFSLDYAKLVAPLVGAIQELEARVKKLEEKSK